MIGIEIGKGVGRVLTIVQYAWKPGKGGLEATKEGDSPSPGAIEDIDNVGTTDDLGKNTEF